MIPDVTFSLQSTQSANDDYDLWYRNITEKDVLQKVINGSYNLAQNVQFGPYQYQIDGFIDPRWINTTSHPEFDKCHYALLLLNEILELKPQSSMDLEAKLQNCPTKVLVFIVMKISTTIHLASIPNDIILDLIVLLSHRLSFAILNPAFPLGLSPEEHPIILHLWQNLNAFFWRNQEYQALIQLLSTHAAYLNISFQQQVAAISDQQTKREAKIEELEKKVEQVKSEKLSVEHALRNTQNSLQQAHGALHQKREDDQEKWIMFQRRVAEKNAEFVSRIMAERDALKNERDELASLMRELVDRK